MRFGFVTCVQLGLSCMEAIYDIGGHLDLAVTLPDDRAVKKSGRIYLDAFCESHSIPLKKVPHINDEASVATIRKAKLDWMFIIGWSQIAGPDVLCAPRRGVLGMHPTLLPEGRGRAAIPWAILKGLTQTGVTLFKLEAGIDTGPILGQLVIPMTPQVTATQLYAEVEAAHISLMKEVFPKLAAGTVEMRRQDEARATIWPGRTPADGGLDLSGSVAVAERLVRATTRPYPGAFAEVDGRRTIIWSARISPSRPAGPHLSFPDGYLEILESEPLT